MVKQKTIKMEFVGKERIFTNNSAFKNQQNLDKMLKDLQEATTQENVTQEDIFRVMGEYVATIFEDFEAEEMLEADELEIYLIRGLNTLKNMYKMGAKEKEIEEAKTEIIKKALEEELFRLY